MLFIGTQFSILYTSMYSPAGAVTFFRIRLMGIFSLDGSIFACNSPLFRILFVSPWEARCIVGILFFDGKIMCDPELH